MLTFCITVCLCGGLLCVYTVSLRTANTHVNSIMHRLFQILWWILMFWSWCDPDPHVALVYTHIYLHNGACTKRFLPAFQAHPIIRLGGVSQSSICHLIFFKKSYPPQNSWEDSFKSCTMSTEKNNSLFSRVVWKSDLCLRPLNKRPSSGMFVIFAESVLFLSISCCSYTEFVNVSATSALPPWLKRQSAYECDCWVEGHIFSSVISRNWAYTSLEHSPFGLNRNL